MRRAGFLFLAMLFMPKGPCGFSEDVIQEVYFENASLPGRLSSPAQAKKLACLPVPKPPVVDGRLEDACWSAGAKADGFVIARSGAAPAECTEVRVVRDAQALYFAFTCRESQMQKLSAPKRAHDEAIWNNDVVEIFLDPGDQRREDFHFILSAGGARWEGRERLVPDSRDGRMEVGAQWNGAWRGAVFLGKDFWTAEIAIPFTTFGLSKAPENAVWAMELMREQKPRGEISVWSSAGGGFGRLTEWGYLVFGNPEVVIRSVRVDRLGWGENVAMMTLDNPGRKTIQTAVVPDVTVKGRPFAAGQKSIVLTISPAESKVLDIPLTLSDSGGEYQLSVSCMDVARKRLLAARAVSMEMPALLTFSLERKVLYVSDKTLVARVEIGATDRSVKVLRLVGLLRVPGKEVTESRPVGCAGVGAEVIFRVPAGPPGEYLVGVLLTDANGKEMASRKAKFRRIPGPLD